jgi:hypothetical protein
VKVIVASDIAPTKRQVLMFSLRCGKGPEGEGDGRRRTGGRGQCTPHTYGTVTVTPLICKILCVYINLSKSP